MVRFFNFSAKRQRLLDRAIEACTSTNSAKKLKMPAGHGGWIVSTHILYFLELLPATHTCLQAMVHPYLHSELGQDWKWDGK